MRALGSAAIRRASRATLRAVEFHAPHTGKPNQEDEREEMIEKGHGRFRPSGTNTVVHR